MVKFSKQFKAELVPEWKEAFVDYLQLKKDLKKIRLLNGLNPSNKKKQSPSSAAMRNIFSFGNYNRHHEAIQVHRRLASSASMGDIYETELLQQFKDIEAASEFFVCLDLQLNKVNQFYKAKEKEFLERGECLKNQMDILIELKAALTQQCDKGASSHDSKDDPSISCHILSEEEQNAGTEQTAEEQGRQDKANDELEKDDMQCTDSTKSNEIVKSTRIKLGDSSSRSLSGRVFNCQGKNLRVNIPMKTPIRGFSAISFTIWEDLVHQSSKKCSLRGNDKFNVNKTTLHQAEKMINGAFIELYKGLGYLKTYRNLNMLAFAKILKKFEKVTNKQVLPIYLRVVESSYFNCSDKVIRLSDEVEEQFIKHFAKDDKKKAMRYLKPNRRNESHAASFFTGLFTGCFIVLLAGYIIMTHITSIYTKQIYNVFYMEIVYPVLSMFSLLCLHFFLYGCNILMWRKARINYSFIFELAPMEELKYGDIFLICTTAMTVIVGFLFIHLSIVPKGYSSTQVQVIPGCLVLIFLLLLVCPFNIVYRSSRYHLLCVLRNIILSPLYKVVMLDFFMADQLCSQVPSLRNLEYVTCYYLTGSYKTRDYGYCIGTTKCRHLAYAVSLLPYYWRAMQCARRWFDEGQTSHLANLGKYVSAMVAAGAIVAYEKEGTNGYLCLVIATSSAATIYQLYWDFVKDWGLLQFHSRNAWLRNELMLRHKFIYYLSMVLNFILRFAWLHTVLHPNFRNIDYRVMGLLLAALEVIRRGQWNFYRLENEHLNNAGKFRAIKTVPLPFYKVDDED